MNPDQREDAPQRMKELLDSLSKTSKEATFTNEEIVRVTDTAKEAIKIIDSGLITDDDVLRLGHPAGKNKKKLRKYLSNW